jgi:hypothetical protein
MTVQRREGNGEKADPSSRTPQDDSVEARVETGKAGPSSKTPQDDSVEARVETGKADPSSKTPQDDNVKEDAEIAQTSARCFLLFVLQTTCFLPSSFDSSQSQSVRRVSRPVCGGAPGGRLRSFFPPILQIRNLGED